MNKPILFILLMSCMAPCLAQDEMGLYPPSVKWKQIRVPTGKVIFPEGLDTLAFRTAGIMTYQRQHDSSLVRTGNTKEIPVILQNLSTLPAGFSTPAPWRSEFSTTPPHNLFLGPTNYLDALTIHEYRHTQQFHMANQGLTLPYKILLGQSGWLLNSLMVQPLWFREGDAVVMETILTRGGRGRLPSFNMEYKAMRMAGNHYDYEKGSWISFRDFVPNPYRTGYHMVTKARRDYGDSTWKKVLYDSYHRKGFIYPFSRCMQQQLGLGTRKFYAATMNELDSLWKPEMAQINRTPSRSLIEPKQDVYTSYRYPHYVDDSTVVAMKSGFNDINTYYLIADSGEKKLFVPGVYTDDHITTVKEGGWMAWGESAFHERWRNKDYSVIKVYDFASDETRKLTSKSRYFSPAPSPDGKFVAVTETDFTGHYALVILDAKTGEVIRRLPNEENLFFTQLRWKDESGLVAVALNRSGAGIVLVNATDGSMQQLLDFMSVEISRPYASGKWIFFSGGFTGTDNIYAVDVSTREMFQVTDVPYGAFEPAISPDGKRMVYSEYTADGYRLREMDLRQEDWKKRAAEDNSDLTFHEPLQKAEGADLTAKDFPGSYEVRDFSAFTSGLFNIYGWLPLPNVPEYGVEAYTQNIMSTLRGTVGALYNTNENSFRTYINITYAALYPLIDLGFDYGLRSNFNVTSDSTPGAFYEAAWRQNSFSGGLRLPFRLTQGKYLTALELAGYGEYYRTAQLDTADLSSEVSTMNFPAVKGTLNFSHLLPVARRHVKPRWGQTLESSYEMAFGEDPLRIAFDLHGYFPGIALSHSLNFRAAYKHEAVVNTFRFVDDFVMPRGYNPAPFENMYVASVNYEFPIWYPDLSIPSTAFFQRLRLNLFFDFSEGKTASYVQRMTSAGGELMIDFRLLRLIQMTPAFRYSYAFNDYIGEKQPFQFLVLRFEIAN